MFAHHHTLEEIYHNSHISRPLFASQKVLVRCSFLSSMFLILRLSFSFSIVLLQLYLHILLSALFTLCTTFRGFPDRISSTYKKKSCGASADLGCVTKLEEMARGDQPVPAIVPRSADEEDRGMRRRRVLLRDGRGDGEPGEP